MTGLACALRGSILLRDKDLRVVIPGHSRNANEPGLHHPQPRIAARKTWQRGLCSMVTSMVMDCGLAPSGRVKRGPVGASRNYGEALRPWRLETTFSTVP